MAAIAAAVICLASAGSHLLVRWLGIVSTPETQARFGPPTTAAPVLATGSSLVLFGVDWDRVGRALDRPVETRTAPAASPCELEILQREVPQATLTCLGVSAFDLNEHFLGDFRSQLVPLHQAIRDLWQSGADWAFSKRVLSQYPLNYIRWVFPTAGRSVGVMVGLRAKTIGLLRPAGTADAESGPTLKGAGDPHDRERISDWSLARTLRNLAQLRGTCQGRQTFDGPKELALERMLAAARRQGRVVVLVLPVSPAYAREFLTPENRKRFEEALARMQRSQPQVEWVRLDQRPEFDTGDCFWDLAHLNAEGRRRVTDLVLARLEQPPPPP